MARQDGDGNMFETVDAMWASVALRAHREKKIPLQKVQVRHVVKYVKSAPWFLPEKPKFVDNILHGGFGRIKQKIKTQTVEEVERFVASKRVTAPPQQAPLKLTTKPEQLPLVLLPSPLGKKATKKRSTNSTKQQKDLPEDMKDRLTAFRALGVSIMREFGFTHLGIATKGNGSRVVQWVAPEDKKGSYMRKLGTWCDQKRKRNKCSLETLPADLFN